MEFWTCQNRTISSLAKIHRKKIYSRHVWKGWHLTSPAHMGLPNSAQFLRQTSPFPLSLLVQWNTNSSLWICLLLSFLINSTLSPIGSLFLNKSAPQLHHNPHTSTQIKAQRRKQNLLDGLLTGQRTSEWKQGGVGNTHRFHSAHVFWGAHPRQALWWDSYIRPCSAGSDLLSFHN